MGQYIHLIFPLVIGWGFAFAVIALSHFLGPKKNLKTDLTPYECGVEVVDLPSSKNRFDIRFYLVAILFLVFDLEVIFLFPFAYIFKSVATVSPFLMIEMGVFIAILLVGLFYVWKKDVLIW